MATDTSEIWNPTPAENNAHNKILEDLIRRVLKLPASTPKEALYIETGFVSLETERKIKRTNTIARINEKGSDTTKTAMNANIPGGWKEITEACLNEINLDPATTWSNKKVDQQANLLSNDTPMHQQPKKQKPDTSLQ